MLTCSHAHELDHPLEFVWNWHLRPGTPERLQPAWETYQPHDVPEKIEAGAQKASVVRTRFGSTKLRIVSEFCDLIPEKQIVEVLKEGQLAEYEHRYSFERIAENKTLLKEQVQIGFSQKHIIPVESQLIEHYQRLFRFKNTRLKSDLAAHARYQNQPPLKILISGSTGLIGSSLVPFLKSGGHDVYRLVRDEALAARDPQSIFWDIKRGEVNRYQLEGFDAVIHLAGASISGKSWSDSYKQELKDSRVKSTLLLSSILATLDHKPRVLLSTSATGFYGNRGRESVDENSQPGNTFLSDITTAWEQAAEPARKAGIRVVHPRVGIVLSSRSGALKELLTPFRWGVGGVIGSGEQFWSCISLEDMVRMLHLCLMEEKISGPVNAVMPESTTQRKLTATLGKVLKRPTFLPLPGFAVKLLLGEMGKTLLLEGVDVNPRVLNESGFSFCHPDLLSALEFQLGCFPDLSKQNENQS